MERCSDGVEDQVAEEACMGCMPRENHHVSFGSRLPCDRAALSFQRGAHRFELEATTAYTGALQPSQSRRHKLPAPGEGGGPTYCEWCGLNATSRSFSLASSSATLCEISWHSSAPSTSSMEISKLAQAVPP